MKKKKRREGVTSLHPARYGVLFVIMAMEWEKPLCWLMQNMGPLKHYKHSN